MPEPRAVLMPEPRAAEASGKLAATLEAGAAGGKDQRKGR